MKKWLIILLIAGGIYYLHEKRPTQEMHQQTLYFKATGEMPSEEILAGREWEKLHLRDFIIVTTFSDVDQFNLVSYGYLNRVKIVDKEWTAKAFKLEQIEE